MKKLFFLCFILALPMMAMADVSKDICFDVIQAELTKREGPTDSITVKSIESEEGNSNLYHVYAWIEDKNDSSAWPFHSYWGVMVEKSDDKCTVQSLVFIEGNM